MHKFIGIRPGEKLHEQMIGIEDAPYTYEYPDYYKILPQINSWDKDRKRIKNGKKSMMISFIQVIQIING